MIHQNTSWLGSVDRVSRYIVAALGAASITWAIAAFPTLSAETVLKETAAAVMAGEVFKPQVLDSLDFGSENRIRSSVLGKVAIIRLRQLEIAINSGDTKRIDASAETLKHIIDKSLESAPNDSFLWLARFWHRNLTLGLRPSHFQDLRMSYEIAPHEGWIAIKRNGLALSYYSVMPRDVAEMAVTEFIGLVHWGYHSEAAQIVAGPARPLRTILFPRLKDANFEHRRRFAQTIYGMEIEDVPVPGIPPPKPQVPLPVLPPHLR